MLKLRKVRKKGKLGKISAADLQKEHSFKKVACTEGCGRIVQIDAQAETGKCWYCTTVKIPGPEFKSSKPKPDAPKKPKGWHFMKVFVDSAGNVFHEGKEQPKLKGTLSATPIKPKKTRAQKDAEKEKKDKRLVKLYEKKKRLKEDESSKNSHSVGGDNLQV